MPEPLAPEAEPIDEVNRTGELPVVSESAVEPVTPQLSLRWRVFGHLAVIGMLLVVSVAAFARVWLRGHPASTVLCQCGDPGQAVWFMSWVPWAITHAQNPLFTTRMLAGQGGANLLQSTSYLLPSFVLAPITWLFGPTVSFNVASTLGPVLSGWAMYWATGRVSRRFVPRAAAALFYGCSPFLFGSAVYGHLNFTWLWFPPLLFLVLHEIAAGNRIRPLTSGLLLGLLVVAEFFTGTEPLLLTVMAGAVGLLVALIMSPRQAWERRFRLLIAFGSGLGVAVVLLAYPFWFLLRGPRRVKGPPWPGINVYGDPLGSIIHAGGGHPASTFSQIGGYFGPSFPSGSFLGIWFLVLLAASVPLLVWLRRKVAVPIVVAGAFAWLCSLGTFLTPLSSHSTQWWLPWKYIYKLPLLQNVGPQRFAFVVSACAALMLALALDSIGELLRHLASTRRPARATAGSHLAASPPRLRPSVVVALDLVLVALVIVVGVPIASSYRFPLTMNSGQVPQWFLTAARSLPPNTRVLTYPYASSGAPDAMYWHANDGLGFELVGGRALIPGADGKHSQHVDPIRGTGGLLTNDSYGLGPPPPPSRVQVQALRSSLAHWGVDRIVVVPRGRAPAWALAWFTEATGKLPRFVQGAAVWDLRHGVSPAALRLVPPAAFTPCAAQVVSETGLHSAARCMAAALSVRH